MHNWFFVLVATGLSSILSAQTGIRLAAPIANCTRSILQPKGNPLTFDFRMKGAKIRYTTKLATPSSSSPLFTKDTLWLSTPQIIRARSFHPNFLPSAVVGVTFIDKGKTIDSLTVNTPNPQYSVQGAKTLFDQILADRSYRNNCLGFTGENADVQLYLHKRDTLRQLRVSIAIHQDAWIFGPSKITILNDDGAVLCEKSVPEVSQKAAQHFSIVTLNFKPIVASKLRLIIEPLSTLPGWHAGFPGKPWLFLDEVLVD